MCKQYVAKFEACGHAIERLEFLFRCEWFETISANVEGVECPELSRSDSEFVGYCHQCLLTAVLSKENHPPGPLLPSQRISPEDRLGAKRILDLCQGPADRIYYDESAGRSHPYEGANVGLCSASGELSVADMYWLYSTISDITAAVWEQWENHDLPSPALDEIMLLIQMREAFIVSKIMSVQAGLDFLDEAITWLQATAGRAYVLQRLPSILTSINVSDLATDEMNCIICLERFGEARGDLPAEFPARLPCNHVVGSSCIRTWIEEASDPLRICTLCNLSFGIVGDEALKIVQIAQHIHALGLASELQGPLPDPAPEAEPFDRMLDLRPLFNEIEAARPNRPPFQSPYWIRLLKGDGSVFRATNHHHRFRSIRRRGRQ
jgi:hypothetical protein